MLLLKFSLLLLLLLLLLWPYREVYPLPEAPPPPYSGDWRLNAIAYFASKVCEIEVNVHGLASKSRRGARMVAVRIVFHLLLLLLFLCLLPCLLLSSALSRCSYTLDIAEVVVPERRLFASTAMGCVAHGCGTGLRCSAVVFCSVLSVLRLLPSCRCLLLPARSPPFLSWFVLVTELFKF